MGKKAGRIAIVVCLAAGLAACDQRPDEEDIDQGIAEASAALKNEDPAAAVIRLKALLQVDPDSAPVRVALGKALLAQGSAAEAAVEFEKAEDLGHDRTAIANEHARALLGAGELDLLMQRYRALRLEDAHDDAELRITLAMAAAASGRQALAEEFLAEAAKLGPELPRATVLRARMDLKSGQPEAALARLDRLASGKGSEAADAWLLKGEIQQGALKRTDDALASFRAAVQADPEHIAANRALVLLLLARGDTAGAEAHIRSLEQLRRGQNAAKVLRAMLDFERKDYAAAREKLLLLLATSPTNPVLLELAGATEYRMGSLDKALTLLKSALERNEQAQLARSTLAQLYLQRGQPDQVLETLAPLLSLKAVPSWAASLAGQAHLMLGETAQAQRYFAGSAAANPDDEGARVGLALTRLAQGEEAAAIAELQALARSSKTTSADTALIAHYMRRSDWPRALAAIEGLARKQPGSPAAALLRGQVLSAQGDRPGARASYEQALAGNPNLLPAVQGLAGLDILDGKPGQARARLQALADAQPRDARTQLALAEVLDRIGTPPEAVIAALRKAVAANPGSSALWLRLINTLLRNGETVNAMTASSEALAEIPVNLELLHAKGRVLLAAGEYVQAETIFADLAHQLPKSPQLRLDLANARIGQGDLDAAENHLRQALRLAHRMPLAQEALVSTLLLRGRADAALTFAREVQKSEPRSAIGYFFEGDVESQRQRWEAALAAYRHALQLEPSGRAALRLHSALTAAGRTDEAARHAKAWTAAHPEQLDFAAYLADQQVARGDLAGAEAAYRQLLQRQPGHPGALNNLAWLLLRQGKPGALALAEQAAAAAPYSAAVQDTLAQALAAEGDLGRAAELQSRLVERFPGNPDYRLNLARVLIKTGNRNRARDELAALAALGEAYPRQSEVAALQDQL